MDIAANTGTTQAYTNGVLTSKTDFGPTGSTVTSYSGGLVSGVDSVYSDNSRCSIQYDAYGNTVSSSITDANGAITSATTMADGSIFTRYPDGAVSSTTLNDAGLPTVVTQYANGSSSVISYTGAGTSVTLPNGMLSNIVDQNAGVSFAAFTNPDGSGSIVNNNADGSGSVYSYQTDGSNNTRSFGADGRTIQEVTNDASGRQDIVQYAADGTVSSNTTTYKDGSGNATYFNADGSTKQQVFVQADGTNVTMNYNTDGTTQTVVNNADGTSSVIGTNADGTSYTTMVNADGTTTASTYDTQGNLAAQTNYNADGSVSSTTIYNADGSSSTTSNDPTGTTTSDTSASGVTTIILMPALSTQDFTNPDGTRMITAYLSDGTVASRRIICPDGSGLSTVFDQQGNPAVVVLTNADGSGTETAYGPNGYSISFAPGQSPMYMGNGTATYGGGTASSTYESLSFLSARTITFPDGSSVRINYDNASNGRMSEISISNAAGASHNAMFYQMYGSYFYSNVLFDGCKLVDSFTNGTMAEVVTFHATYDSYGRSLAQSYTFADGASDTMSYYQGGRKASEVLVRADGSKVTLDLYSTGDIKDLTHYRADGSVQDCTRYYSNGQLSYAASYQPDGSLLTTSYFTNGLKSGSSWTGRPDGSSVFYEGHQDGSFVESSYSADGSCVVVKQDAQGDVVTSQYDAGGFKLGDKWSKPDGTSGTDFFNADGSSQGTAVFQSGIHSQYTNDGHGNVSTVIFDRNNVKLGGNWQKVDGSSGTDFFNADGSGSGMVQLSDGNGYNYSKDANGNTSYEYHFNTAGNIEIPSSANANNILKFGAGISLVDLAVTATLGSDGKPALLLTTGNGHALTIDGGLNGAVSQFSFADGNTLTFGQLLSWANVTPAVVAGADGNLVFDPYAYDTLIGGAGNDTLISGAGYATFVGGAGMDTFVVNNSADVVLSGTSESVVQSSVSYSMADNAQTIRNLMLTGAADLTAIGNNLGDVITANGGNDVLIGGTGNDTLIGGAGLDTFVMNYGMGQDTVIDTSTRGGIIQLDVGMALSDVVAVQQGNDLLLQIAGSTDGMLIKDYYSNQQAGWTIKDGAGNAVTPQDMGAPMRLDVVQLENDFRVQAKDTLVQQLLWSGQGYTLQTDGTLLSTFANIGSPSAFMSWGGALTVRHNVTYLDGSQKSYTSQESWGQASAGSITNTSVSIQTSQVIADSAVINAVSTVTSDTFQRDWVPVTWNGPFYWDGQNTVSQVIKVTDGQGNVIGYDQQLLSPSSANVPASGANGGTYGSLVSAYGYIPGYNNNIQAVLLSSPGNLVSTGAFPQVAAVDVVQHNVTAAIQQIDVGAGNHIVYGAAVGPYGLKTTIVNSGVGDNVIYDAGFVYTGTGNDTVINAGTVYCGSGNNQIINADTVYGGTGNDTMTGGGTLVAGAGNDLLIGGGSMVAGGGNDRIFAGQDAATTIQIDPTLISSDLIGGAGISDPTQLLDSFYQNMGIYDWKNRYQYAGNVGPTMYYLHMSDAGYGYFNEQDLMAHFNGWGVTLQDVLTNNWADIIPPTPVDPLPVLATVNGNSLQPSAYYTTANVPVVNFSANDFQTLSTYFDYGLLPQHTVAFGAGIAASDLQLSWSQTLGSISGLATDPQLQYTTLNISWGTNGQNIQVMIPHSNDPLGSGVSLFTFADGTSVSMADMIAMAPPAPTFDPQIFQYQAGMGVQTLGAGYAGISFGPGITASQITLGLGSLMLRVGNTGDVIHITNFDPSNALGAHSIQSFAFADGTNLSYEQLLSKGFDIYGTAAGETLSGTNLVNRIYAADGGGSTLIGTGTSDTLVSGAGNDTLIGGTGNETFVVNDTGDVVIADANAASNAVVASVSYVATENVANLTGSGSADITLAGNNLDNVITGNAGYDTLVAGSGNDTLIAGTGGGVMVGGSGQDTFVFSPGSGQQTIVDSLKAIGDVISFGAGISAKDVSFSVQGADVLLSYSPTDSILIKNFDLYGLNGTASPFGSYQFADGSSISVSIGNNWDGPGSFGITRYDSQGSLLGYQWGYSDGSHGTDIYNADGSRNSQWYNSDGSYGTYVSDASGGNWTQKQYDASGVLTNVSIATDDGHGNSTQASYDGNGLKLSDSWGQPDGSWGWDNYAADGSSNGAAYLNHIGSFGNYNFASYNYTYTRDSYGNYRELDYAYGNKVGDKWSRVDGSHGYDYFDAVSGNGSSNGASFNADGSYSTYTNDGQGHVTTNYYDVSGTLLGYSILNGDALGNGTLANFDANGNQVGYGTQTSDGAGNVFITNYDANGIKLNDSWVQGYFSHGNDTFNADGSSSGTAYYSSGNYYTYTKDASGNNYYELDYASDGTFIGSYVSTSDGAGNSAAADYNAAGIKLDDSWAHADGSRGYDTYNADGSSSGTSYNPDGSYSSYVNNGAGDVTTQYYDAGGNLQSYTTLVGDGHGNGTTTSYDAAGNVLGSSVSTDDGLGNTSVTLYDATGVKLSDTWAKADGTHGTDTFNAGGSSSGISYNIDGSYSNYVNDGAGNITTQYYDVGGGLLGSSVATDDGLGNTGTINYDAAGIKLSDAWAKADGTHGTDTFNADGSSNGTSYKPDGSYSTYANDGQGHVTTSYYDVSGNFLGNGGITTPLYDANGNVIGTNVSTNDGQGNTSSTNYDLNGNKLSDTWTHADGSQGNDTYNPDGSYVGNYSDVTGLARTSYYGAAGQLTSDNWTRADGSQGSDTYAADGSHTSYTIDAQGTTTSANYDTAGHILGDYWVKTNGSQGSDTYAADGSHSSYTVDAQGTSTSASYDTAGHILGDYWVKADGSQGSDTYAADGSHTSYTVDAQGTSTSSNYDTTGRLTGDYWIKTNGSQGSDTYYADGTHSSYTVDTQQGTQSWLNADGSFGSTSTDANGAYLGNSWGNADGSQVVSAGGNVLLIGSAGTDYLNSWGNAAIVIGGAGNDNIATWANNTLIAFNKGDGQDIVNAAGGQNNTLSLGGNFAYNDLALQRNGNDLILDVGANDNITFQNWYGGSNHIVDLQVINTAMSDFAPGSTDTLRNSNVENFDFQQLVAAFDQAQAANPGITAWGVTNDLLTAFLNSSDTAALGGDLAFEYGARGSLSGMNVVAAESTLSGSQAGMAPQALNTWNTLNTGTAQIA